MKSIKYSNKVEGGELVVPYKKTYFVRSVLMEPLFSVKGFLDSIPLCGGKAAQNYS